LRVYLASFEFDCISMCEEENGRRIKDVLSG